MAVLKDEMLVDSKAERLVAPWVDEMELPKVAVLVAS